MPIVRWDPFFREWDELSTRLDRAFGRSKFPSLGSEEALAVSQWSPSCDIVETSEEYIVKAELPGVKKEDVKVSVDGGVLRIEGERRQEKEEKNKKFHRVETVYGHFTRTFTLPQSIDEAKVRAEYKDGVLNVHLMKSTTPKPKSVEIKVA